MDDTTVDEWMNFFRDAGIPPNVSASYASSFCQNRIHLNMVMELNRDILKELGVTLIGDAIAILRHAKSFHEQNVRQKIFNLMSPEFLKPPVFCKKLSTTDVTSITNSKMFDGDITNRDASPVENNLSAITTACKSGNNQEVVRLGQQTQLASKQNTLLDYGISTSRPLTTSPSQVDNAAQNISVGTLQKEELLVCEAFIPALGEADTTEKMSAPYSASKSHNNVMTSHSESFLMRGPVESCSTLPLRQVSIPSTLSGGNYICRRNPGLKKPMQQSTCSTIVSTSQQPAGRLPCKLSSTPTVCQSPMPRTESNTLQDEPDEIIQTPSSKRKRTSSYYGSEEQQPFDPDVCMQSVGTRVARQSIYEPQNTFKTDHSEELQVQGSPQLGAVLPRQDMKNEMTTNKDPTKNHSTLELQCQQNLQRKQEASPVQERLQMSLSLSEKLSQPQIMSESELSSHKASPSQMTFLRSQSNLQNCPTLKMCHENLSSLPNQPWVQPQSSQAVVSQANGHKNLELENQKVMMQCDPARSSSRARFILATGKNTNKKFKLLHSRPRPPYMTSVPHSSGSYQVNEVQRQVRTCAISRCTNKSVLEQTENNEKEELLQNVVESGNVTCISQNGSETEFIGTGGDLLEEDLSSLSDLNTERSAVRWDTHQLPKPVAHTSDSCGYEDPSSHIFSNSSGNAENNLQRRVPGQIFSRLGVKVEVVSVDNDVCNTAVRNDALQNCRLGSSIKYKINKTKKQKVLPNKFSKIMAVKQLPKNKLFKRNIVFKAFQKATTTSRQNIVPGQTPQEVTFIDGGQPKLRGILKSQTSTSKQEEEETESQKEEQSQKMTANLLLESVNRSGATDLDVVSDAVQFEENSMSNDCTKSEDKNYTYQDDGNFCSDNEQQEELSRAPTSGISKAVHFGPVCVKEFEENVLPTSRKTTTVFRRLGARKKGI